MFSFVLLHIRNFLLHFCKTRVMILAQTSISNAGIFMRRNITLKNIYQKIEAALHANLAEQSETSVSLLKEVLSDLDVYSENGIDFRAVADNLDDSLVIADKEGRYLYSNPSYTRNTGIYPEMILGRTAAEIEAEGKIFTHGAAIEVLRTKSKAFRLSTVYITGKPEVGFVAGVPIFDESGDLTHIAISSRPIFTLSALQDDFHKFLNEANSLKNRPNNLPVRQHDSIEGLEKFSMIGKSAMLEDVREIIAKAAPTDATVLITGESGCGKEVVADEIYRHSRRTDKSFIKVNCASIPQNLLESELFGYEKGAFSGASVNGKKGLFELANGGTLLLDEIGDMPLDLQVKLLRAIQNREITRVGGTRQIKLDIRFIAATNSDLRKKVSEGSFRKDLFYRLNVIPIQIAPLRERPEDIRPLCDYFLKIYTAKHGSPFSLTENQYQLLSSYHWPGNIRELDNVIEYMVVCASKSHPELNDYMLRSILSSDTASAPAAPMQAIPQGASDIRLARLASPAYQEKEPAYDGTLSLEEAVADYERQLIESVLASSKSLREAGAKLGINASTVSRKIKQYHIDYPHAR